MMKNSPCQGKSFGGGKHWLTILVSLTCCCGCLKADIFHFFSYDSANDSFKVTALYVDIAAENPADRDHLADLWRQRAKIITNPFEINIFGGHRAILRIGAQKYQIIDMASSSKEPPPVETADVPLDAIGIQPGKFFLSGDNRLCYYHQITVPGNTVDEIAALASKAIRKVLVNEIPLELKRRVAGGKTPTWEDMRREVSALPGASKKSGEPPNPGAGGGSTVKGDNQQNEKSGLPIDDVSLNLIERAAQSGKLTVNRQGAEFSVAIPLSANDCREAKQTFDLAVKAFAERQKGAARAGADIPELISMVQAENDHDQRLLIKLNLSRLARLDGGDNALRDPKLAPRYAETIEFARTHEIPIDEKVSLKEVLDSLAK
ncbi:MAG TPA: hypothetical protein VKB78_14625 [Pirellulales bacterium]|nr:hypothetical protein [Pirellulales bacterium]